MKNVEKLRALMSETPTVSAKKLAELLSMTRQGIYGLAKAHGIKIHDGRAEAGRLRRENRHIERKNHFGINKNLSAHFVGGASELIVCAELLRRGIPVYRACTFVSAADLVADISGILTRIEVKSVRRNANGSLRMVTPRDKSLYDVLAMVDPDGHVTYRPPI